MNSQIGKPNYDFGLNSKSLGDSSGFVPKASGTGSPFVWILSASTPQPSNKRGVWYDNKTWVDTNIWYD